MDDEREQKQLTRADFLRQEDWLAYLRAAGLEANNAGEAAAGRGRVRAGGGNLRTRRVLG
jgi:hypothetical protein